MKFFFQAIYKGVSPLVFVVSLIAPFCNNLITISFLLCKTAKCKGDNSFLSKALISAPKLNKNLIEFIAPE